MYRVVVAYAVYASILSCCESLEEAAQKLQAHMQYYINLGYPIREAYIEKLCSGCKGEGRVRKCKHKKHAFFMEKCYKTCVECKGNCSERVN